MGKGVGRVEMGKRQDGAGIGRGVRRQDGEGGGEIGEAEKDGEGRLERKEHGEGRWVRRQDR